MMKVAMAVMQLIPVDQAALDQFCQRWKIVRLELAGSFSPSASEIMLLTTFESGARRSLLDHVRMERELGDIFGRKVDLVSRRVVEAMPNELRRSAILASINPVPVYG
jgi:predicted nucleotidyltransferase